MLPDGSQLGTQVLAMNIRPRQFGLSTLIWLVVFAAFNFWLISLGVWGTILAIVIDKHVLVAYLCMVARVDQRRSSALGTEH